MTIATLDLMPIIKIIKLSLINTKLQKTDIIKQFLKQIISLTFVLMNPNIRPIFTPNHIHKIYFSKKKSFNI